jgi:hypothetical protein
MSSALSRSALALLAGLILSAHGRAQDPIPVAYWSHQRQSHAVPPGVNAFTVPPQPMYNYYYGPQMAGGPLGSPEMGIRSPFIIPACAPNCSPKHHLFNFNLKWPAPIINDQLPTHPYARSPRDFFMFHENLEAERSRDLRPAIVP